MTLSLLQLNANADNYFEKLIQYLLTKDFDVIQLQEMTGAGTVSGNINAKRNTFAELQKVLEGKYNGVLTISQRFTSSETSYLGNATFYKKEFQLVEKEELVLSEYDGLFPSDSHSYEEEGRKLLHLKLSIDGKSLSLLNTHFAWAKTSVQEQHQTKQGEVLLAYLKTVQAPFILSGDFNLDPEQPLIKKLDTLARNLTREYDITNTLNPQNHRAKSVFPKGLAVDYIFISHDIIVNKFTLVTDDLSDHFGLITTVVI